MKKKQEFSVLSIIGFILSLTVVFGFVGVILCIIALIQISKHKQRGFGLAVAGIVIGFVMPALVVLAIFGLFAYGYSSSVVVGSGSVIVQNYDLSGFDSVTVADGADLLFTQGDVYSVRVEAEDNVLELLEVEVDERGLEVGVEDFVSLRNTKPILVYVTMPEVATLTVEGSGNIESFDEIASDRLILRIFGSGSIDIMAQGGDVDTKILGSGDIHVSGEAVNHNAIIEGSGRINGASLEVQNAVAEIMGSGNIELYATEMLDVTITGSGRVKNSGGAVVTQRVSGSGEVVAL